VLFSNGTPAIAKKWAVHRLSRWDGSMKWRQVLAVCVCAVVLGGIYLFTTPPPGRPFWIEGHAWAAPENCPYCGDEITRRDAEFVECKRCGIHMLKP
jgi:hypothetical protein